MTDKKLRKAGIIFSVIIMTFIFIMSARNGTESDRDSMGLLELFVSGNLVSQLNVIVRKCAHMAEFAALSFSVFLHLSGCKKVRRKYISAITFSALYAVSDELHQYFVPGRSCQIGDVLFDTAGAVIGAAVCLFLIKAKKDKKHGL